MNYILFDDPRLRQRLLPFTFTRPVAHLRLGILTIAEKWERWLNRPVSCLTQPYLQPKFPLTNSTDAILINGAACPTSELVKAIFQLRPGEMLTQKGYLIAWHAQEKVSLPLLEKPTGQPIPFEAPFLLLKNICDLFAYNGAQIRSDFTLVTHGRTSQPIDDPYTRLYNPSQVFVEEGVQLRAATLNAENGPIYLGRNSEVRENAVIRGPFAMGEGSVVNTGARMIGDNTIGPFCKVGGEVSNSIFLGYSNKVHDGFLGNSVLGEWCNLGADTNTSNLKNDYGHVKLWSYEERDFVDTGRIFCGLMMGDHSKTGINTMFNTGTVVGVNANVFGGGYPPKYIPSFSWGGSEGLEPYRLAKALAVAEKAMERRNQSLTDLDRDILQTVYEMEEVSKGI